jgi:hypothetical protein
VRIRLREADLKSVEDEMHKPTFINFAKASAEPHFPNYQTSKGVFA